MLGASGTIGQATVRALVARGHEVVCFVRPRAGVGGALGPQELARRLPGAELRYGEVTNPSSLARDGFAGERFDVLMSCLASRTGAPGDAWAIDHQAHVQALNLAQRSGVTQMVMLSAICVQKPLLAFQQAKLAFEKVLIDSAVNHSIVRPTAFFKSLSGQVERVRQGRPFVVFGDGRLTACKPISDDDLGDYLAGCVDDESRHRRVLPIGGPGPALTPRQQGEHLFALLGREPRFKQVPVALMDAIIGALGLAGRA
ncbi:MAG: NAD(P)H-binding protein, partial [Actinomycetes bacterium]